jgi:hypothetical protein
MERPRRRGLADWEIDRRLVDFPRCFPTVVENLLFSLSPYFAGVFSPRQSIRGPEIQFSTATDALTLAFIAGALEDKIEWHN